MMNLPEDFISEMNSLLGEEAALLWESYNQPPSPSLRIGRSLPGRTAGRKTADADISDAFVTPLTPEEESVLNTLKDCSLLPQDADSVAWEARGFYYPENYRPGRHILHEAGFYYIQEASAMAPASLLAPRCGQRVLDLCAAPGGKSTRLGTALQGRGLLVSNEPHSQRAKILSENIERLGISNALVTSEYPDKLVSYFPLYFDSILVDAPCSGEGMFRKSDTAVNEWSRQQVLVCAQRQLSILESAHKMLRPGGRLCYSTCTFSREENESIIEQFLKLHPEYTLLQPEPVGGMRYSKSFSFASDSPAAHCIRLMPQYVKGEGHFVALLRKTPIFDNDVIPDSHYSYVNRSSSRKKRAKAHSASDPFAFLPDWLSVDPDRIFTLGAQIYLLPPGLPSLDGLRLLRPGLHLGTLEKERFTPATALAKAIFVDNNFCYVNLPSLRQSFEKSFLNADYNSSKHTDITDVSNQDYTMFPVADLNYVNLDMANPAHRKLLADYYSGNTFPYEGEKGWYLICANGLGVGWGKLSGGIMKNHYPKGIRKTLDF